MNCKHCGRNNHWTRDCHHLGKSKCDGCGKFRHAATDCWHKACSSKRKFEDKEKEKEKIYKKPKKEETNEGEEIEEITFNIEEDELFNPDEGESYNFEEYDSCNLEGIDECVLYYDWLADSATTSHVTNQHEAFTTYQPLKEITVAGVGNIKTIAKGRGTVELESQCDDQKYIL
jgi:hypothetical protein